MLLENSKILLVEDSKATIALLQQRIEQVVSVEIIVCHTLEEAKIQITENPKQFFVGILDLNLPDAPNGEIVDYVIENEIPAIVLTGTFSDDLRDEMIAKNVIDYVVKQNSSELDYVAKAVRRVYNNRFVKVLIVDDSRTSRQFIRALLEVQKFQILEASDGVEALAQLEANPDIMLVLTDYHMPNMDGIELISNIRKNFSRSELCIIGFSNQGSGMLSAQLLKSGANDFITRPFLLEEFNIRLSQNIDLLEQIQTIRESANKDYLTGLYNRKYLFETGEKLYENSKIGHTSLAAAMIDIDNFKAINDNYGHFIGDIAIKEVAMILINRFGRSDIVARFGGEEFCVMVAHANKSVANNIFEDIRQQIERLTVKHGKISLNLTVSIGVTLDLKSSIDDMLHHADTNLYKAKNSGKNKTILE